eukprot:TRINITY_DN45347_c0_g1_i1.p1 TRINITY_DN45347_c0_g1~~TRINITY_DN45347_c0_g1_i1.p1  ORF type:complete len:497 (-),score=80.48 TRINITY_DN45347_c0_g1_i1:61-1551(-)
MAGVIGSGVRPCQSRRYWLLLAACAMLANVLPAKVAFALPGTCLRSHSLTFHRQRRDSGRLAGSTAILGELRHAIAAVAATYSPSAGEEWTPEEERRVMEDVLGRVPPSSRETSSLTAETRLLRQQTEELAKEIRLLREVLRRSAGAAAEPAPAVAPSQAAAPTSAPMPQPTPAQRSVAAAPAASTFPTSSPPAVTAPSPPAAATTAKVVSAGHGDGNIGDFFINGRKIDINGQAGRRGMNVVTIDPKTQQVTSRKTYDVWGEPRTENMRLSADINSMPDGRIVLVACKDSGLENLDSVVFDALRSCGARINGPLPVREGYALIGVKGGTAYAEQQGRRVEIEAGFPFFVRHPPPLPPQAPSPPAMSSQAPQGYSAPTWSQKPPVSAPPQSSFASAASGQPQSTFPTAAPPQSTFPTAPPSVASYSSPAASAPPSPPPTTVRVPKLQVDPQGGVRYDNDMVEREGRPEEDGQSWQEVVLMLDRLQEKIKAKRLSAV